MNLTPEQVELLRTDLAPLARVDPALPERVLAYVLEGRDAAVLQTVGVVPDNLEGLRLSSIFAVGDGRPRHRFFQSLTAPDPALLLRLAQLYEAASRTPVSTFIRSAVETRPRWLGIFLVETRAFTVNCYPHRAQLPPWLTWAALEDILAEAGEPREAVVTQFLMPEEPKHAWRLAPLYLEVPGFPEACSRHGNAVSLALQYPSIEQQAYALKMLADGGADAVSLLPRLVELTTTGGKTVSGCAEVLLRRAPEAARPLLERVATSSRSAEERERALRLLAESGGAAARRFLEQREAAEPKPSVRERIADLLAALPQPELTTEGDAALAPLPPLDFDVPLTVAARAAFDTCVDALDSAIGTILAKPDYRPHGRPLVRPTAEEREDIGRYVAHGRGPRPRGSLSGVWYCGLEPRKAILAFLAHSDVTLLQAVRFLSAISLLHPGSDYEAKYGLMEDATLAISQHRRRHTPYGLRELAQALEVVGGDPDAVGRSILRGYRGRLGAWEADAQWPYFTERMHLLVAAFEPSTDYGRTIERSRAFPVLKSFAAPPARLAATLWTIALGTAAKERASAQAVLQAAPDVVPRAIAPLASTKAGTRAAAAEWLGRLRDPSAVAPLHTALAKERHGAARAAMLVALEALGEPVDCYLDREVLLAEARAALKKAVPEAIGWFPFESLPAVHWRDTGEELPGEVVRAWLVEAHALKTPEPGPLLRRYAAALRPEDREALGQLVLEAWLDFDVRPPTDADARRRAERETEYFRGPLPALEAMGIDQRAMYEDAVKARMRAILGHPVGSAAAHRGLLAVAGACAGAGAAPAVARYLKEWYGQRAGQCKALLQMLAWVEHPSATQLVLSVGERFRTKGIQREARRLAEALAEARGWTVEELADRSVPTAGLDENGVFALTAGARTLTARFVGEDLLLFDENGRRLSSAPRARRSDDAAAVAVAKKAYADARKEVKATVALQRSRLYEALCTERRWRAADWKQYVLCHPIVGALARRLVWSVSTYGAPEILVRAREDGSFVDIAGAAVSVAGDALVRVAHASRLDDFEREAWERHLDDLGVPPLFDQFSWPPHRLDPEQRDRTDAREFEGHVLNGLALRRRLMELGYLRGPFQGHTWFDDYRKPFPAAAIDAVIQFTGARLNEEDCPVALLALTFSSQRPPEETGVWYPTPLTLGEVPVVLLSECWNDMKSAAALGTGYDPAWLRTVGWER
jgi:hypothetical protein